MKRIKHSFILFILCAGIIAGMNYDMVLKAASNNTINRETAGEFEESQLKRGDLEIRSIHLNSAGKLISYYVDEDGINKKAVYNEKKDVWVSEYVKDSFMKIKGEKKYYSIYPTENGYIEVAPDSSKLIVRNQKGKKKKVQNVNEISGWKKNYNIRNVKNAGKDNYLFICQRGKKKTYYAVYVNLKSGKVKWEKDGISPDIEVIKNKLYSYFYDPDKVGNPSSASDIVRVYNLKNGVMSSVINATSIRNLVTQLKGAVTEDAFPITDQQIQFTGYNGKLYAAYMSGIFVCNTRTGRWDTLIDGVDNQKYMPGSDMTLVDLLVRSDKEFYILAAKGNDEGEATDFIKYQLK